MTRTPVRSVWRRPAGYLSVLLAGLIVMDVVFLVAPKDANGGVPPVANLVVLVWAVVAVALWVTCRHPVEVASGWLAGFLIAYLAAWMVHLLLGGVRGEVVRASSFLAPFILALIALKRPSRDDVTKAADVLAWTLVFSGLVALWLEARGFVPAWDGWPTGAYNTFERTSYWLPLADVFGINGRWVGPWVHPSLAGAWGGFLVVWGSFRKGLAGLVFPAIGLVFLVLTASRTSLAATIVALAVAWVLSRRDLRTIIVLVASLLVLAGPSLLPTSAAPADAVTVVAEGSMSGRTTIWPVMLQLWGQSPVLGVGDAGIRASIASGALPDWAIQAHDIYLDAGVRAGLVGFIAVLAVFVVATVITVKALRSRRKMGLVLLVLVAVGGLTDMNIRWVDLLPGSVILLLAVLLSAPDGADVRVPSGSATDVVPGHLPETMWTS